MTLKNRLDLAFWIPAVVGVILTVTGAGFGFWSAVHSHYESIKEKLKSDRISKENKTLLIQTNEKSIHIIDQLNISAVESKFLLDSTRIVISSQKIAGELLQKQLNSSLAINESINHSVEKVISTLISANKKINDSLTGGDSYCIFSAVKTGNRKFSLAARNNFDYAIPNSIITIENYSALERCRFYDSSRKTIDVNCYQSNSHQAIPTNFGINQDHFLLGNEFIDLSGNIGKLVIRQLTPNHHFYTQIIYQVKNDTDIMFLYRTFQEINLKYEVIKCNDDKSNLNNSKLWDQNFQLDFTLNTFDAAIN